MVCPLQFTHSAEPMPYLKRIVCLANSFKKGGTCVAGKEVLASGYGGWIRPVSARPTAELWLAECVYERGGIPKPLDIVDVPLLSPAPRGHQTENHLIDPARSWVKVGQLPLRELPELQDRPAALWINSGSTSAGAFNCVSQEEAGTLHDSLALIRPQNFVVKVGSRRRDGRPIRDYRARFEYRGVSYILQLTDPDVMTALEPANEGDHPLNDVHICVSLSEPWEKDKNRCHKLVAAVFNKPSLR